jgi:zinc transport system substrate-binding protein
MRAILVIGSVLATVMGPACGTNSGGTQGLFVVATIYPAYEVASRVGGGRVEPTNLTPAGVEPHDVELTSTQVDDLLDADLVLYVGAGFQPAVEDVLESRPGTSVDLLKGLPLLTGTDDHGEEDEGHSEEAGTSDPHVWLDPRLMAQIVDRVSASLSGLDPAGKEHFEANATRYQQELADLDRRYRSTLATCDRRTIVTTHAAFGYLARRYGLHQEALAGLSPEAEPDPRRFGDLADLVRQEGITTVFYEELVPSDLADALAREAGVRSAVLSPIEGLSREQDAAGATYLSVMQENLAALSRALGCHG